MAAVRLQQAVLLLVAVAVTGQRARRQQLWRGPTTQDGAPAVLLRRSSAPASDEWRPLGPVGPVPIGPTLQYAPPVLDGGPLRQPIRRRVDGPLPQAQPGPPRRRRPRPQNQPLQLNRPLPPRRRPTSQRPPRPQNAGPQRRQQQRPPPQQQRRPQRPPQQNLASQRRPQRPPPQQNIAPQLPQQFQQPPQQIVSPEFSQPPQRRPERPSDGLFRPPQLAPNGDRFSFSESDADGWAPAGFAGLQSVPPPVNIPRPVTPEAVRRPELPTDPDPVQSAPPTDPNSVQSAPPAVPERVPAVNAPPSPAQTGAPAFQPPVDRLPANAFTPIRNSEDRRPEVRPASVERVPVREVQDIRPPRPVRPERPLRPVKPESADRPRPETPERPVVPIRNDRPTFVEENIVDEPTVPEVPEVKPASQHNAVTAQQADTVREQVKDVAPERKTPTPGRRPAEETNVPEITEKEWTEKIPIRATELTPATTSATTENTPSTTKQTTTTATTIATKPSTARTTTTQRIPETTPKRITTTKRPRITRPQAPPARPTPRPSKKSDKSSTSGTRRRKPLSSYLQRRPDLNRLRPRPRPGARPSNQRPEPSSKTTTTTTKQPEATTTSAPEIPTTPKSRPTLPQRPSLFRPEPSAPKTPEVTASRPTSRPKPLSADRQALIERLIQSELQSSRRRQPPSRRRPGTSPGRRPLVPPGGRPSRPQRPSVFDRLSASRPTRRPSPLLPVRPESEATPTEKPVIERPSRRPPVLPVRPSTEEPPSRPVPILPERPTVEKPVRRPTPTLPHRPSLEENADQEALQTTEVSRPSRRPRPPQLIRPSADRPGPFSKSPANRPGLFARPSVTRPEPIIRPSALNTQQSVPPFVPAPPKRPIVPVARPAARPSSSPPPVNAKVPVKVEKPERVSIFTLATQRPPTAGSSSFGIRPVTVAQNLVAKSPYRHTGGYSSIKMFGINAGKKHVSKPKKAAYKEKSKPVTNTIGLSSGSTSVRKLPRADHQAEQPAEVLKVQSNKQYVPGMEQGQAASTTAEELRTRHEETAEAVEPTPQWQGATGVQPHETSEPQTEETTEAHQMATAESRLEAAPQQHWIPGEQAPTEHAINNIEAEPSTEVLRDQEAAAVTDRILSEIENEEWTPMQPKSVSTEHQETKAHFGYAEQSDRLFQPKVSAQHYIEPEQTIEVETTEPEESIEASGYQQLEYYIEDPSDLQADDSVWSPVVSGVVRVPVRPAVDPPAAVGYQPADEPVEEVTFQSEESVHPEVEEEIQAGKESMESYPESVQETSITTDEQLNTDEQPRLDAQVDESFFQVEQHAMARQEENQGKKPNVKEPAEVQNTNRPVSSRPHLGELQPLFEEGPRPHPAGQFSHLPPRPRPPRPGGGWMSGLLSGLFGGRPSGPGPSGSGGGGLLAGLFRRPASTSTAAPLPPVQNDPILAAMFGAPGGQQGEAEAGVPEGRQEVTDRPEGGSPQS